MKADRLNVYFVALALMMLLFLAGDAQACSCAEGGAPCQEYWESDAVFTGTVLGGERIKIKEAGYEHEQWLVRLSVGEAMRGISAPQVEVITGLGGGDCGYPFKRGETYLVYANRGEKDQKLYTGICNRTRPLADADEDLTFIRSLATAPAGGFVFGRVVKRNYEWEEGEEGFKTVPSAELTVEGEKAKYEVKSDAQGNFRFEGVAPGTYKIGLKVPLGLTGDGVTAGAVLHREVKVAAHGCAQVGFYLESDTRITGRVIDALGLPVADLPLQMRGVPTDAKNINTFVYARTDAEGVFEFKTVPPGGYLLGLRILNESGGKVLPYPRTYYPGVPSRAGASIVRVKEGEHVRDVELRLPPRLVERSVEGSVVWADGRPAPGASISVSLLEDGESSASHSLYADERGRFRLKIYEGLTYRASAYPQGATGAAAQSEWVDVRSTPDAQPIRLVLPVLNK